MIDFLQRLLGSQEEQFKSKDVARERLRLVLVQDRCEISPQILQSLKEDLIGVISDYMEIDEKGLDVSFSNLDSSLALVANIPIVKMKRSYKESRRKDG